MNINIYAMVAILALFGCLIVGAVKRESVLPLNVEAAHQRCEMAVDKARYDSWWIIVNNYRQYYNDLSAGLKEAMQKGPDGLDDAIAIRTEMKRVQAEIDQQMSMIRMVDKTAHRPTTNRTGLSTMPSVPHIFDTPSAVEDYSGGTN